MSNSKLTFINKFYNYVLCFVSNLIYHSASVEKSQIFHMGEMGTSLM